MDYGPKHRSDEPTTLPRKRVYHFMPEVNAMGYSGGGVSVNSEKTTNEVRRWMFTGQLMPGKAPNNAVACRTLKWELNDLDSQSFHNNVIRTGLHSSMTVKPFGYASKYKANCRTERIS